MAFQQAILKSNWKSNILVPQVGTNCIKIVDGKIRFKTSGFGLGDKLCALTALRVFARSNPSISVFFDDLADVVCCFKDSLVTHSFTEKNEYIWRMDWTKVQNGKNEYLNLVGAFMSSIGIPPEKLSPEVPHFQDFQVVKRNSYVVIQTSGSSLPNPNLSFVQDAVNLVRRKFPVIAVGHKNDGIKHIDDSCLGSSLPKMFALIENASLVIAPHSATVHIAAGYRVPSVIWTKMDHPLSAGRTYYYNYDNWNYRTIDFQPKQLQQAILDICPGCFV